MNLLHKKFTFPDGCSCKEIVMRETNGLDEQRAARLVDVRGGVTGVAGELVRQSVVMVDGEKVIQPYMKFDEWNTKTRNLVMECYEDLNGIPGEDIAALKEAGTELSPAELANLTGVLAKKE